MRRSFFDVILVIFTIIYVISPLDLFPGPADDVILALCTGATEVIRNRKRKK